MTCTRCGGDRLFQFQADPLASKRAVPEMMLPLVCRGCGQITVDGVALAFPEALEAQAKDMATAAAEAGAKAVEELAAEGPEARVTRYFQKVYREAYLDGFLRCLAFYQHNTKEGKLKRLRELWQLTRPSWAQSATAMRILFPGEAFEEFDQLMNLGPVPD